VSTTPTTVTVTSSSGGPSATVTVPVGALPIGTTVSAYSIIDTSSLAPLAPSGQSYVIAFAVSWQTTSGTSPSASTPLTMTIKDPSIVAGDTIYELTSTGLVAVGTATVNGSAVVTFSNDPVFVVASPVTKAQARLRVTSVRGVVGTPLTLATSGGSGTGALSYRVTNGTASGCSIKANALSATSAGTCLVTATKAADANYSAISSVQTTVTLSLPARPVTLSLNFAAGKSSLSASEKSALVSLSKKLLAGASVTITGYAKANKALALSRARVVANYLSSRVKVHVTLATSTSTAVNKVTVRTVKQ
jgi:outer membrane protein OmpA-like peptidoglycan-associated protein